MHCEWLGSSVVVVLLRWCSCRCSCVRGYDCQLVVLEHRDMMLRHATYAAKRGCDGTCTAYAFVLCC
jgi:hypothetical protein